MAVDCFRNSRRNDDQIVIANMQPSIQLVRISGKVSERDEEFKCVYGLFSGMYGYPTNANDGFTLEASEVIKLRDMLDRAIKSGEVCETLTEEQRAEAVKGHRIREEERTHHKPSWIHTTI